MPYKDPKKQKEAKHRSYIKHKEQIKKYNKTKKINFLNWFYKFKSSFKCEQCGETDIVCLDFHHKDPKQKEHNIRDLAHARRKNTLLGEIKKCICLCSNCHRKLHHMENLKSKEGFSFILEEFRNSSP